MQEEIFNRIKGKKIAILGFGMEGRSTYKFIRKFSNMPLYVLDQKDYSLDPLLKNDHNVILKSNDYLENLDNYDLIIKAPGVVLKDINIDNIKDKITSQLELLLEINSKNIVGITGTKGKSTTTTLIYEIFKNEGYDAYLLGNIGRPIFDDIASFKEDSILVIEMSALQLEFVKHSPHVAIILNLFEEHLDHAGSIKHYHENKLNIFKYQKKDDIGIYAADNFYLNKYVNSNNYKQEMISVSTNSNTNMHISSNYIYYKNKKLYDINSKRNLIGKCNLENINKQRHNIIINENSTLYNIYKTKTLNVISLHLKQVKNYGSIFNVSAKSEDGVIEALEYYDKNNFICGVQYHPELDDNKIFQYFLRDDLNV